MLPSFGIFLDNSLNSMLIAEKFDRIKYLNISRYILSRYFFPVFQAKLRKARWKFERYVRFAKTKLILLPKFEETNRHLELNVMSTTDDYYGIINKEITKFD